MKYMEFSAISAVLSVVLMGGLGAVSDIFASDVASAEEQAVSAVGYATVEAAHRALEQDESASSSEYDGWLIFNQKLDGKYVLWSFTPMLHPANPSVVKREIVSRDQQIFIEMSALCESEKTYCDELIEEFKVINEHIRANLGG